VTPLYAVQVEGLVNDAMIGVDAAPITKQVGVALEDGQVSCENAVTVGTVSDVQVTVWGLEPEIVAARMTPFPDVLVPIAKHAGVVALVGHTICPRAATLAALGNELAVQVDGDVAWATAAAPALEP
jgi:hypothetical protein